MDSVDDFVTQLLPTRVMRRTYLVTYSQADLIKFPTRESFGEEVSNLFDEGSGKVKTLHWACCLEPHHEHGQHYHLAIKLTGPKRWISIKTKFNDRHGAQLNFSEGHDNYYTAYKYICKEDEDVYHSDSHPNLKEAKSPKTNKCVKSYRSSRKAKRSATHATDSGEPGPSKPGPSKRSKDKISNLEFAKFVVDNDIKEIDQLFAVADEQMKEGKEDLACFVLARSRKSLAELQENAWHLQNARKEIAAQNQSRMDVVSKSAAKPCSSKCNGQWYQCAIEVLRNNNINTYVYADALRELLRKGRGKFRNLMLIGPTNCGKTFLLSPLQTLFSAFSNPSNDKYAWIGVDKCQVIFLNDFRWSSELIAWKEFLLLLEGQMVHLPTPKNHFNKDICLNTDIPVFATGKSQIKFIGRFNAEDERETEMMSVRWKYFELSHQIPQTEQKSLESCPSCFSKLVLLGDSE